MVDEYRTAAAENLFKDPNEGHLKVPENYCITLSSTDDPFGQDKRYYLPHDIMICTCLSLHR